jgi:hypothetical protein
MFRIEPEVLVPLVFALPILAIVGGITSGIVRSAGRQRLIELQQRERIAAIERGIDPSRLPPLPDFDDGSWGGGPSGAKSRAQGLMIAGLITLFAGVGITAFLLVLAPNMGEDGRRVWAVGLIPQMVGLALLLSAWIVWPRGNGAKSGA